MEQVKKLRELLAALPDDAWIGIGEGGLTLEVLDSDWYYELGGMRDEDEDADEEAHLEACPHCGVTCNNDVTISDHGMCRDCLSDWQFGRGEFARPPCPRCDEYNVLPVAGAVFICKGCEKLFEVPACPECGGYNVRVEGDGGYACADCQTPDHESWFAAEVAHG